MAAFANKGVFSPTLASLGTMRSGSSVTVKRSPFAGPRVARKEAAALNGPTGQGLPTGHTHGTLTVMVRRAGTVVASLDLSRASGLKLGR